MNNKSLVITIKNCKLTEKWETSNHTPKNSPDTNSVLN